MLKSVGLPVGASDFGFQLESISLSMSSRWFLKGRRRNAECLGEAKAEGLWFPTGMHQSRIELDMFVEGLWFPTGIHQSRIELDMFVEGLWIPS